VTGTRRYTDSSGWQQQAGYSRAVRRGPVITVSGTTAAGPDGTALCPGDTLGQARLCLQRVLAALAAQAHREVLGAVAPANTMLYVAGLIGDGFCVEVEAMAVTAA
jgi:enamine deaminase RidA (YjgF/YER057c/UK114 family)